MFIVVKDHKPNGINFTVFFFSFINEFPAT